MEAEVTMEDVKESEPAGKREAGVVMERKRGFQWSVHEMRTQKSEIRLV